MRRTVFGALAVGIWTLFALAGAAIASGPQLVVNPSPSPAGGEITVRGDAFEPMGSVEIRAVGADVNLGLARVRVDERGSFSTRLRLPAQLEPGTYQLRTQGSGSVTAALTVLPTTATAPGETWTGATNMRSRADTAQLGWVLFAALMLLVVFIPVALHRAVAGATPRQAHASPPGPG